MKIVKVVGGYIALQADGLIIVASKEAILSKETDIIAQYCCFNHIESEWHLEHVRRESAYGNAIMRAVIQGVWTCTSSTP